MSCTACIPCLTRGLLLQALAAHIDRSVDRRAGDRARDLLGLGDDQLARSVTRDAAEAARITTAARASAQALSCRFAEGCAPGGLTAVCTHWAGWPREAFARLGTSAPRALFLRGDPEILRGLGTSGEVQRRPVTIVGSRRAGAYGREVARALAADLGAAGMVVVSGLALGIDTEAHLGALASRAPTVAVLGAGADRAYPRSRARLYEDIASTGIVISELPPGSPTFRWTFPARNRIMAALGEATVVVEAASRSGSLITAEMAGDCGRVVAAVPGPVNSWRSEGANDLLADGALVVRDAGDVLEALLGPGAGRGAAGDGGAPARRGPALEGAEAVVLDLFERGERTQDELVAAADGLDAREVAIALSRLERAGYLCRDVAGGWDRTGLSAG